MKLLTFNEDWADEHNVPAIACFTDEEYQEWCNAKMGKVNPKYDIQMLEYENQKVRYNDYMEGMVEKGLMLKSPIQYTAEEKEWVDTHKVPYPSLNYPQKGRSYLTAYLGNNGDCFGEDYNDYLTGQDFIDNAIVTVTEVSEDFHNTFHAADLSYLSLCNIFSLHREINDDEEDEED